MLINFGPPEYIVWYGYYEPIYWREDKLTKKEYLIVKKQPMFKPGKDKIWFYGDVLNYCWTLESFGKDEISFVRDIKKKDK